ncbi:MAG: cysteate synthase [Spirochaetaceae bacterium]|nr:MAG: cysteate synthase [Spirochaetaceae bacterium]
MFSMHYSLTCLETGAELDDESLPLCNPAAAGPAFLRTTYLKHEFTPGPADRGLYRFADWLPVRRTLAGSCAPVTYRSEALASRLGLSRLFITFSGYWPERGAYMLTGTFKECEAYSVCARMPSEYPQVLVVASAGNTARAFTRVCSENGIPLVVVIPERNLSALWAVGPVHRNVRVVAAAGDSDYSDAISLAGIIASLPGFGPEGGARNVARRDGMGTTVLSAVDAMGAIPDHYFQAVGSGTGAIAAWEANLRLLATGGYGKRKMRLHLSQNAPFAPIHESWQGGSRTFVPIDEDDARVRIALIGAKVLANRNPPYGIRGGIYDALRDTDGTTSAVDNSAADAAGKLFERLEGIDLEPAAAVAVADLIAAVRSGMVKRDESVMLNVTGGGYARLQRDRDVHQVMPHRIVPRNRFTVDSVSGIMAELFARESGRRTRAPAGA